MFKIKSNFPDADFWLQTRGSKHNVGQPKNEFVEIQGKYNIGIKITDDSVDKYEPGQLKDRVDVEKVDEIYESWVKQTEMITKVLLSTPEYRVKGKNIQELLRRL